MTRQKRASILAGAAAAMLVITAAFHYTGFDSVSRVASEAGGDLAIIVPLLWLSFSIDLVALGLIAALIARQPARVHRPLLLVLAAPPLSAALMQVWYIGFVPPTAVLLLDVGLLIAAAISVPPSADTLAA
jgi:hypothetical protein